MEIAKCSRDLVPVIPTGPGPIDGSWQPTRDLSLRTAFFKKVH